MPDLIRQASSAAEAGPESVGPFGPDDDALHEPSGDFYETETFWYSFFVPERSIGAWLYASVRQNAGVTGGGMWLWDATATDPWEIPFYEQFSMLRLPHDRGPDRLLFPTGMSIVRTDPLYGYDLTYADRDRMHVELQFQAVEAPVPLLSGAPPYPKAHHFDQTGHVAGRFVLDGSAVEVDCYAMRDRSWGPRAERGYHRVGYTWGADEAVSFLTYSSPTAESDEVHTGYVRRDGVTGRIESGRRVVARDPAEGWVTGIELDVTDSSGRRHRAAAEASSRMILPGATNICINTSLRWDVDGRVLHGEDQDVWPIKEWRASRPSR